MVKEAGAADEIRGTGAAAAVRRVDAIVNRKASALGAA